MKRIVEAVGVGHRIHIELGNQQPRVGRLLRGRFVLGRRASAGDEFVVVLTCRRDYRVWDSEGNRSDETELAFEERLSLHASGESGKLVVPFEFNVHVTDPPTGLIDDPDDDDGYIWRMSLQGVDINSSYKEVSEFILQMGAAPYEEVRAGLVANETPELTRKIENYIRRSRQFKLPHQRFKLAQRPDELEMRIRGQKQEVRVAIGCFLAFIAAVFCVFLGIPLLFVVYQVLRDSYRSLFGA